MHDVSNRLVLVKIVVASQHKGQRKVLVKIQDLLTVENTDSDLKVHVLYYENQLLVRVIRSFQKCLQTRQTSRNNTKLSKTGFA